MISNVFKKDKIIFILGLVIIGLWISERLIFKPKLYTNADFDIPIYYSLVDKDNDGIDDATDILMNVKEYIQQKPKYKSKYYETGYSNDLYGVCTDVIAYGLVHAGYDIMNLVNIDIKNNPTKYNLEHIDKAIDFRRVKNLKIYFANNAIALTTNILDINNWQAGDIVVFENHIGIISDKRNKKGIPLVIHHERVFQLSYEEDILSKRKDIVGHYRIS